ncbi:LuxR family two component transcriptional regulator [Stackebrandtia albiflava]|uniref:LuxR family two component transcriptional regulator n=1 Tax=Stackebrandtia albiflava TaxID=406432 RepID=A0A562V519_9ACTN|nr:response regulator transcription factor [Stackebrandtia albiflava]TWJ12991.1 LuxR family two component transcriptional regulator [Stackebrandtia albiflava]
MTDGITLVVVDDHPVVRDGLVGMLSTRPEFTVVGEAAGGAEALTVVERTRPDVVVTDLRLPPPAGADLVAALLAAAPVRVLVFTTFDGDDDVFPAIEVGASGYLLKDTPREELFRAVHEVARGESVLSPTVARRLIGRVRDTARRPEPLLSAREVEVLRLVGEGNTNRAVAAALFVSEATVKTHLLHIYAKLDVKDRAAAVAAGYTRGLL